MVEISGGTYEKMEAMQTVKDSTRQREAFFLEFAQKARAVENKTNEYLRTLVACLVVVLHIFTCYTASAAIWSTEPICLQLAFCSYWTRVCSCFANLSSLVGLRYPTHARVLTPVVPNPFGFIRGNFWSGKWGSSTIRFGGTLSLGKPVFFFMDPQVPLVSFTWSLGWAAHVHEKWARGIRSAAPATRNHHVQNQTWQQFHKTMLSTLSKGRPSSSTSTAPATKNDLQNHLSFLT